MLDPEKYEFCDTLLFIHKSFLCDDVELADDINSDLLFSSELTECIKGLQQDNFTVEIGNITSTLLNEYTDSHEFLYSVCLTLYRTEEQKKKVKEKEDYLKHLEDYCKVWELEKNVFNISLTIKNKKAKEEYERLHSIIMEETKYAKNNYHYASQEYKDYYEKIYKSAKMDFDRLNRKYNTYL